MPEILGPVTPVIRFVRGLAGDYYLRAEVAAVLDVSATSVRAIGQAHPELAPSARVPYHGTMMALYTPADVERLRAHYQREVHSGAGRPRLWTPEEVHDRERRQDLLRYHRKRLSKLEMRNDSRAIQRTCRRITELQAGLDAELQNRLARKAS